MVDATQQKNLTKTIWEHAINWKHFEEELLPPDTLVELTLNDYDSHRQWMDCCALVGRLRDAKMSWKEVDMCRMLIDNICAWKVRN